MEKVRLFTIGFTRKSAEQFFTMLSKAGVKRVIDIRLHNVSQLAGFAKRDDLRFFLKAICGIDYLHMTELAPTQDILDRYKKKSGDWTVFEKDFLKLISERRIEQKVSEGLAHHGCLLCGEEAPDHCHRRLVAEYLRRKWGDLEIVHLV